MIWGLNLYHLVNLQSGSTGPRSVWCEASLSSAACSLLAGRCRSHKLRGVMLLWLSVRSLTRRGQKQEGTERGEEISGSEKRQRGKGKQWGRKDKGEGPELPECGFWGCRGQKGRLSKRSDTEARGSGGRLSPGETAFYVPWVPDPFLRRGQLPHSGHRVVCYWLGFLAFPNQ